MGELAFGGVDQGSIATGAVLLRVEGDLPRILGGRDTRWPKDLVTVRTWSCHCISVVRAHDGSATAIAVVPRHPCRRVKNLNKGSHGVRHG